MTLLAADWNPDLHPRGRDGRFIEVLGLIQLFDFDGPDGTRGRVTNVRPGEVRGNPDVDVELSDGRMVTVKPDQIAQAPEAKASLKLYRGEGSLDHPSYYRGRDAGDAGGYWTEDLESARRYAKSVPEGKVYEIEVDRSETEQRGLYPFIPDPEVRARRRLLAPQFGVADPVAFITARDKMDDKFKPNLTPYVAEDFGPEGSGKIVPYLREDGLVGYAVKPDGEIVNVFSMGEKGAGETAILSAVENGGWWTNNFSGFLEKYYGRFGFQVRDRMEWDDQYAPDGWDYERDGRPDVIEMELPEGKRTREYAEDTFRRSKGAGSSTGRPGTGGDQSANGGRASPGARRPMDGREPSAPGQRVGDVEERGVPLAAPPARYILANKLFDQRPGSARQPFTPEEQANREAYLAKYGEGSLDRSAVNRQIHADAELHRELVERVHGKGSRKGSQRTQRRQRRSNMILQQLAYASGFVAADWNPDLHPRGWDGKFIEVFGLIDLIDMAGFRHGQRGKKNVQGEVIDIIPDPDDPGNPIIRVKMTDPRWDADKFGASFDARSYQVSARDAPKAKIEKPKPVPTPPPDVAPPPINKPVAGVGTPLPPMGKPPNWDSLTPQAKHQWVKAQMEADLAAFRGEPTIFDLEGAGPEMEHALAERYRWLTHIDPETALRVDAVVTDKQASTVGDERVKPTGPSAIAVAHPGTDHPGGIGPVVGKRAIVLGENYFQDDKLWQKTKGMNSGKSMPWSVGANQGDETSTMVHEFGHQRQFRYLAETMLEAGQPFSKVGMSDGFGTMPDSSNWPEVQEARYAIQNLAPSSYGRSKSSEAYAEVWTAVTTGYEPVSPELQEAWDIWHSGMSIPAQMPQERFDPGNLVPYHMLGPVERDEYWTQYGSLFDLPGMREHYPQSAALYDEWKQGQSSPSPEVAVPNAPFRSTFGAKHEGFAEVFNLTLDELETQYGDLTDGEVDYIGTGLDDRGRKLFRGVLEAQVNSPFNPLGAAISKMELAALDGGVSIWDLPSMSGVLGQVASYRPDRGLVMVVNPTINPDPTADSEHHPGVNFMRGIITHEYGHVVNRSIDRKMDWKSPTKELRNVNDRPQAFQHYSRWWSQWMGSKSPTEYGSRNDREAIAESFVRYHFGMPGGEGWDQYLKNARMAGLDWFDQDDAILSYEPPDEEWWDATQELVDMIAEIPEFETGHEWVPIETEVAL